MLSAKHDSIKYHFLSRWYDSTGDLILVSQTIGEHSTHLARSKLAIFVEGDPTAPFPIASTLKCWRGRNLNPWIAPLYPWSLPYNAVR